MVAAGPAAKNLLLFAAQMTSFLREALVRGLAERGVPADLALAALAELIRLKVIARPHEVDA